MSAVKVQVLEAETGSATRPHLQALLFGCLLRCYRRERNILRCEAHMWRSLHKRAQQRARRLKSEVEPLQQRIRQLENEVEALQARVGELQSERFGPQSERCPFREEADARPDPDPARRRRGQQKGAPGHSRTPLPELPVREQEVDLGEADKRCPGCGEPLASFPGCEQSEVIEVEVQAYRRCIRRPRYRPQCRCRQLPGIVTAPPPGRLIPHGKLGVSVWAQILLDKYLYLRPTQRLLQQWADCGLRLSPGTVAGGLPRLLPLFEPLCEAIREHQLSQGQWHADETSWRVFSPHPGRCGRYWALWVFCSESTAYFLIRPSRATEVAQAHFGPACGWLVCDRYTVYKKLAKAGRIRLAHCWAHMRRDFLRVAAGRPRQRGWAEAWVERIGQAYRLNNRRVQAFQQPGRRGFATRDRQLRQALAGIRREAARQLGKPSLPAACRKVLESLQGHWATLSVFADHPQIPMDNNAAERALRGPVVGRKNFYGSGSRRSARLAAALFTVLHTVRLGGLNPRSWLLAYLHDCAGRGGQPPPDLSPFLPWQMGPQQKARLQKPCPGRRGHP